MKDTNDEKNIEILINELGVFELRGVARQLGIPSPTTKKRDELISLILESIKNGGTIKDSAQKRGRPYKKLNVLDNIANKINNEVVKIDFSNTKKVVNFEQEASYSIDDDVCEGIIQKYNFTIEMYDIRTGVLVKFDNTEHYDQLLTLGDKVKTTVNLINDVYQASKIISINDQDIDIYRPTFVRKGEPIISDKKVPFATGEAVEGRRNIYKLEMEIFETNYLQNLMKYCENNDYTLIILATNTSFENEIMFNKIPLANKFMASYGTKEKTSYHKILDALNYAENLVERGKKVVLFVADIIEIVKCLESYMQQEEIIDYSEATKLITQKLLKFARAYENGVSGTLIMCYNEIDCDNKFLVNDIMKISKRIN